MPTKVADSCYEQLCTVAFVDADVAVWRRLLVVGAYFYLVACMGTHVQCTCSFRKGEKRRYFLVLLILSFIIVRLHQTICC